MVKKDWGLLAGAIALSQFAGIIGSGLTFQNIPTWYASLNRPAIAPPNFIFGPVWIALYTLMGISLWLVLEKEHAQKRIAVAFFGFQLALNALWSIIFFGLQNLFLALAEISVLWLAIIGTIYFFYKIDKRAAYLMLPYLVWVSFAAILNYSFWLIN